MHTNRGRTPTNAHQAMRTNDELGEHNAQQQTRRAAYTNQLPTRTKHVDYNELAPTDAHQAMRGRVATFGLEGRETLAGAYSRELWR